MIKKFLLLTAAVTAGVLSAALPGDIPGESKHKLEWVNCSPMPLGKLNPEIHRDIPALRAVVFMYTKARDTTNTFIMLENLRRQYQRKLLIAAITPDSLSDAKEFQTLHPDARVRLAVDTTRQLTPEFMNETIMLFPMAFLIDASGTVIWRGEAVDLPEAAMAALEGKIDVSLQKKLAPMIYKMQQSMRDGNWFKTRENALNILQTDPANPAALRMAVFASETMNQPLDAWNITVKSINQRPDISRSYFTALDLAMRYRNLRKNLPQLIEIFNQRQFNPVIRFVFADTLLNNFPFDANAVLGAEKIIAATPMTLDERPSMLKGQQLAVRARLHYAFGNLKAAEADLSESVKCFTSIGDTTNAARAEAQLNYLRTLLQHLHGEKR